MYKRFFLVVAIIGAIWLHSRLSKQANVMTVQPEVVASAVKRTPAVEKKVFAPEEMSVNGQVTKISEQIDLLSRQREEVDHELDTLGFPKIFLDERLSETEREALLEKVRRSSELQMQIARLKIRKIDLGGTL